MSWEKYCWTVLLMLQLWLVVLAVETLRAGLMLTYTTIVVLWTATVGTAVWLSVRVWAEERREEEE